MIYNVRRKFLNVAFVLLALLGNAGLATAQPLTGKVIGVKDGDTVMVLNANKVEHEIRLAGIDAPEKRSRLANEPKSIFLMGYLASRS
jgi:endonuclease YncB( thermonuclease family)